MSKLIPRVRRPDSEPRLGFNLHFSPFVFPLIFSSLFICFVYKSTFDRAFCLSGAFSQRGCFQARCSRLLFPDSGNIRRMFGCLNAPQYVLKQRLRACGSFLSTKWTSKLFWLFGNRNKILCLIGKHVDFLTNKRPQILLQPRMADIRYRRHCLSRNK